MQPARPLQTACDMTSPRLMVSSSHQQTDILEWLVVQGLALFALHRAGSTRDVDLFPMGFSDRAAVRQPCSRRTRLALLIRGYAPLFQSFTHFVWTSGNILPSMHGHWLAS